MNLSIKEIIIGSTTVVSLGLGVVNMISSRKNKKRVNELEKKIIDMNTPKVYPFQNMQPQPQPNMQQQPQPNMQQQPQPTTVPTE